MAHICMYVGATRLGSPALGEGPRGGITCRDGRLGQQGGHGRDPRPGCVLLRARAEPGGAGGGPARVPCLWLRLGSLGTGSPLLPGLGRPRGEPRAPPPAEPGPERLPPSPRASGVGASGRATKIGAAAACGRFQRWARGAACSPAAARGPRAPAWPPLARSGLWSGAAMALAGPEGYAYTFRDACHAAGVLEAFGAFYLDGSFTDVTLQSACGALFPCHRAVLAAGSAYFKAMFTADMTEKSKQQISLPGLGRAALEALLDYAYTAWVRITAGNVQGLLRAADRLQFAAVKAACERFLLRHLDAANCLGMHAFAQHHRCPELEKEARRLLLSRFEEVWQQEEFVDVSEETLRFVLSRDNLNVRKAEAAIEPVVQWVAHDVEARIDCIYELLGCIKVDLDETYLRSALSLQKKCRLNGDKIRALIYNALNPKPKDTCKRPTAVMYVIGGYYWHPLAEVRVWDPITNAWIQGTDMPDHTRESYGVTSLGPNIYVTGGYRTENIEALDTVWVYNSETDEWREGCPMLNARYYHCAVTLGGCVYALGGYRKGAPVQEAECYDPLQKTWVPIANMIKGR